MPGIGFKRFTSIDSRGRQRVIRNGVSRVQEYVKIIAALKHPSPAYAASLCIVATVVFFVARGTAHRVTAPNVQAPAVAKVGLPAPGFAVRSLDGRMVTSSRFEKRPLFINFFATWCLPCKIETPTLVGLYPRYAGKIQFLSIDLEEEPSVLVPFVRKYHIPWSIGIDSGQALTRFGLQALPESVFIDKNGIVRAIYHGYMQAGNFTQNAALIAN